jgi:hypothetical protein
VAAVLTDATKNALLDGTAAGLATLITHIGLHSADPGAAGGNELAGGTYARVPVTWAAASAGARALSATPYTLNVPAGATVAYIGFWSAASGGTFRGFAPAGSAARRAFSVDAADVAADTLTSAAHGLVNGNAVVVWPTIGAGLPGGLAEGTIYFVVGATTDTFQLAATSGGAAINLTGIGDGDIQLITSETFAGAGTYQVTSLSVSLPG